MPIFTETYAHVYQDDAPRCRLPTPGGPCGWAREPDLPWCNRHLCEAFNRLLHKGVLPEAVDHMTLPEGVSNAKFREAFERFVRYEAQQASGPQQRRRPRV